MQYASVPVITLRPRGPKMMSNDMQNCIEQCRKAPYPFVIIHEGISGYSSIQSMQASIIVACRRYRFDATTFSIKGEKHCILLLKL